MLLRFALYMLTSAARHTIDTTSDDQVEFEMEIVCYANMSGYTQGAVSR